MADDRGHAPLASVAKEGDHADLQAEFAGHVHCAGVTAPDLCDIPFFKLGYRARKIETADKIAYDCHN